MRLNKIEIRVQDRENPTQRAYKDEYIPCKPTSCRATVGEFEVDVWYRHVDGLGFLNYQSGEFTSYGIGYAGQWSNSVSMPSDRGHRFYEATEGEISRMLLKEAKRRYQGASKVRCLYDGAIDLIDSTEFELHNYCSDDGLFWGNRLPCIYDSGKWADIV